MIAGKQLAKRNMIMARTQANRFSSVTMADEESKHRIKLSLYQLDPYIENCWIAPNSVVVGEVIMKRFASVWYNSVVRGDINRVE